MKYVFFSLFLMPILITNACVYVSSSSCVPTGVVLRGILALINFPPTEDKPSFNPTWITRFNNFAAEVSQVRVEFKRETDEE